MFSDIEAFLQTYNRMNQEKHDAIIGALTYLKETGRHLTMRSFIGIGGYNIVFVDENSTSVTRIFFQRNFDAQARDTKKTQAIFHEHPTDAILPFLEVICSKDLHVDSNWIITRTQRVTPLLLVTSPEMAGELFRTSIKTVDYLESNGLFSLDLKLNNFGKVIGSAPSKYVYIDPDFATLKPMDTCYSRTFTKRQLIEGLQLAERIGLIGFSMLGYAFIIALLRFGKISGSDMYGGRLNPEFYRNYLKVYKYLLGIHFYQQFFITKHEYEIRFGEGSSIEYMRLPEEEIDRISKLRDITEGDYSTPQNRVRKIIEKEIYGEEDLFITPTLTRVVQSTDFNPSQINSDFVLSLFEKSEGRIVYPDSPYPPCSDELFDLSLGLYHQSKRCILYDGMTDDEEISQPPASKENSFEIPPPPTIPVPPPPTCSVSSIAANMPSSGAI